MMDNTIPKQESKTRQEQPGLPSKHIRPKIQRKSKTTKKENSKSNVTETDVELEATRKRMESWMGVGTKAGSPKSNSKKNTDTEGIIPKVSNTNHTTAKVSRRNQKEKQQPPKHPVSILRSPKYSRPSQVVSVEASPELASTTTNILSIAQPKDQSTPNSQQLPGTNAMESNNDDEMKKNVLGKIKEKNSVICKDIIVERDPKNAAKKRKPFRRTNTTRNQNETKQAPPPVGIAHHASIEGYTPGGSDTMNRGSKNGMSDIAGKDSENDTDPLVIDSLEGLMRVAGEKLPENPNKITDDTKMVEANISFSVMTQDQYEKKLPAMKEEHEEERNRQLEVFMGKHDIFGDDDDDEFVEGAVDGNVLDDNDDDEDDDAIMELLMGSDIDTDDENDKSSIDRQPEIRAFTLLWDALTNWMTHETVTWVKGLQESNQQKRSGGDSSNDNDDTFENNYTGSKRIDSEWTPMVDRSDIGASRCAGVLAMIRLYLGQCMEELNHPIESRRKAEKRLNDIMRTFDYSRENPKLTAGHWKAMACILLDMVLIETRKDDSTLIGIPPSAANIGMTKDEFEYLSRKAVLIFD